MYRRCKSWSNRLVQKTSKLWFSASKSSWSKEFNTRCIWPPWNHWIQVNSRVQAKTNKMSISQISKIMILHKNIKIMRLNINSSRIKSLKRESIFKTWLIILINQIICKALIRIINSGPIILGAINLTRERASVAASNRRATFLASQKKTLLRMTRINYGIRKERQRSHS